MLLSFPGSCGLSVQQEKASASVLMSCPEFLFNYFQKTYFYVQNFHAVIYLIFCIFSLNLFIVRIVFFIACCDIFLHVVLLLSVEIKALLGLCYMFVNIRQKNKISMSVSMSVSCLIGEFLFSRSFHTHMHT